jgi:ribonuclease P protein component
MSHSDDFRTTVRRGTRAGSARIVIHADRPAEISDRPAAEVRVGFVVSKSVGNAVTRNRVKRRLRHLVRSRLSSVPPGVKVVVRALPPASTGKGGLEADLAKAWTRALGRIPT